MQLKAKTHAAPHKASHQKKKTKKTAQTRNFATFKKVGKVEVAALTAEKIQEDKVAAKAKKDAAAPKRIPTLNDLMRNFYKKIHPDLMLAYPEQREQNDQSLSVLQSFLTSLKDNNGNEKYPVLRNATLPFYLRTPKQGHFQHVELLLHSEATLNKKLIEQQLVGFFKTAGVGSQFKWDDEYFPLKGRPDFRKKDSDMDKEAQQYDDYQQSQSGGANESYDEFMARVKREAAAGQKNSV